jgi:uncharacterized membrane protein YidH (DUF202 family)
MYTGLNHLHSSFRYLVLLFLILAVADAAMAVTSGKGFTKKSKLFSLLGLIFSHIQLVVGLVMYFMSPWFSALTNNAKEVMANPQARFFAVEHISMMIIAIALITVGYSRAKRQEDDKRKSKTILIFYGIGLVLIFAMIPWPFLKEFGTWF